MKSENDKVRRRINALERRADHLSKRIADSDKDLTYDKQELGALRWALHHLRILFHNALKKEGETV